MIFWTYIFEIGIDCLFLIALTSDLKNKEYRQFTTLLIGTIFGLLLEYVNVVITHPYGYSQNFLIQIGSFPDNIPIVIGLTWGILLQTARQITACFKMPLIIKILFESALIVSVDLFLDLVATRLEGGFWVWYDTQLVLTINNKSLFGIGWENYYGWFFVTFIISSLMYLWDSKYPDEKILPLFKRILFCVIMGEDLINFSNAY